ncbi:MAG: hypothetical protein OIN66_07850 [Candidatus Methanoperedens sp.]|nr:hypothetical protein [Candidatus Methanoperedens sp.]
MASPNKLLSRRSLPLLLLSIIILSYSFYTGMLLWGLIAVFQIVFVWVLIHAVVYIKEYIELNRRHIELCDRYLTQKIEQQHRK